MRRPEDLLLRCFAEQDRDGSWFAICIDLNLYARADSLEAVKGELHAIICEYVSEAVNEDREYAGDLLHRPAPLYFRARYWLIKAVRRVFCRPIGRRPKDGKVFFRDVLPLTPAHC